MSDEFITAGPWSYQPDRTIHSPHGLPLARCYADRNERANGFAMAAAPELLDVVRRFMRAADDKGHVNLPALEAACNRARAILSKARGEQ